MVDSCWPIRHELPMKMKPIKLAILSIFGATQLTVENYQFNKLIHHHIKIIWLPQIITNFF